MHYVKWFSTVSTFQIFNKIMMIVAIFNWNKLFLTLTKDILNFFSLIVDYLTVVAIITRVITLITRPIIWAIFFIRIVLADKTFFHIKSPTNLLFD